jgi:hypothetical protein
MRKLALGTLLGALALVPSGVRAELIGVDGSDTKFESTLTDTIGGQQVTLDLTGTALREKAWFNVYAIGSYLQQGATVKTAEELASADAPKKLHLIMERGVDGKKMASAFREAIEANYSAKDFEAELKEFEAYFMANPVEKGDHISFVHEPGVGVVCKVASKEAITIKSLKFAQAVWDIYLGKKNIGEGIKSGLTSRLGK